MTPQKIEELAGKLRRVLANGKIVAVVGWRNSYHDDFTRSLLAEQVVFIASTMPPANTGLILLSDVLDKTIRGRIKSQRGGVHGTDLKASEIKMVLVACEGQLRIQSKTQPVVPLSKAPADTVQKPHAPEAHDVILDFITQPAKELSAMDKFVKAFLDEAAKSGGLVGRRTLGVLLFRDNNVGLSAQELLKKGGWIVPETAQGKMRVGSYRAGEKMHKIADSLKPVPEEPLERARFIIAQKPALAEKIAEKEAELKKLKEEMDLIDQAERLIAQVGELFKSKT